MSEIQELIYAAVRIKKYITPVACGGGTVSRATTNRLSEINEIIKFLVKLESEAGS